jgi:hypothetical protein
MASRPYNELSGMVFVDASKVGRLAGAERGEPLVVTTSDADNVRPENSGDLSVRSVPLDTEDGDSVVIEQQNVGPGSQVGGGEFKNTDEQKSPEEAAVEQEQLDADRTPDDPHRTQGRTQGRES